ncbi:hypothetical protein FOCC_FOCC001163 [Frankliniella occidentalis]|nr:hypothetical protein FOCC_FOCC001163 [Frankliniella occidentalis]
MALALQLALQLALVTRCGPPPNRSAGPARPHARHNPIATRSTRPARDPQHVTRTRPARDPHARGPHGGALPASAVLLLLFDVLPVRWTRRVSPRGAPPTRMQCTPPRPPRSTTAAPVDPTPRGLK